MLSQLNNNTGEALNRQDHEGTKRFSTVMNPSGYTFCSSPGLNGNYAALEDKPKEVILTQKPKPERSNTITLD